MSQLFKDHSSPSVFDPYKYHMDICNELCSSGWQVGRWSCVGKTLAIRHYTQTVKPNFFIHAMLIGIIDFFCFRSLSLTLTLTLPGGHMVSTKQNLLASFSPKLFVWSGWNLMWWWSNMSRTSWDYFRVRFIETREITAVLQTAKKL